METTFKLSFEQLSVLLPEEAFVDLKAALPVVARAMNHDRTDSTAGEHNFVLNLSKVLSTSYISNPLHTLQMIRYWALDFLRQEESDPSFPTGLMHSPDLTTENDKDYSRTTRSITAQQARGVLANAFFANCYDPMGRHKELWNQGGLDWRPLLRGNLGGVGLERMCCHLLYFDAAATAATAAPKNLPEKNDDMRQIVFERIRYKPRQFLSQTNFDGSNAKKNYTPPPVGTEVVLHDSAMENPTRTCGAFVNFANPNFGYGKFIRSCTQEEILESCCPEFTIGLLWIGLMKPDEVVVVRNVRRFGKYSGYLNSFQCQGSLGDGPVVIQDVLTMDACYRNHFSVENIERDINKAYYAFRAYHDSDESNCKETKSSKGTVSTGKWGCGAFGGTAPHKFVQQVLAANLAGVELDFSVFGQPEDCDSILKAISEHKPSAREVSRAMKICKGRNTFVVDFVTEICRKGKLVNQDQNHGKINRIQESVEDLV